MLSFNCKKGFFLEKWRKAYEKKEVSNLHTDDYDTDGFFTLQK